MFFKIISKIYFLNVFFFFFFFFFFQGAQEVFQELPHEYVEPEYLPKVAQQGGKEIIKLKELFNLCFNFH